MTVEKLIRLLSWYRNKEMEVVFGDDLGTGGEYYDIDIKAVKMGMRKTDSPKDSKKVIRIL